MDVESGGNSCYAKDSEGNVFVWGDNTYCQLGTEMNSVVGNLSGRVPAGLQSDFLGTNIQLH